MKNAFTYLMILFVWLIISSTKVVAQPVVFLQYRHVPQENIGEFLFRERTYWSKVAKKAIDDNKMLNWSIWQRIGGWDMPEGSNFMFVNIFENPEDIDHLNEIWGSVPELFPDVPMSSISTDNLGTVNHQVVLRGVAGEGLIGEAPTNFVRINYAKASDMGKYLELEQSSWQPFIKEAMESGKTTQKSWRLAQLMMPAGSDLPFNALTADGYEKMSEAILPGTSFSEDVSFPDLSVLNEVHEKVYIQVYSLVASEQ